MPNSKQRIAKARQQAQVYATPSPGIIAPVTRVKLPWALQVTLTASATQYTFGTDSQLSLGGPYNITGHQPYGWDQYAAFYRRYKVLGTHVRLTFVTNAASSGTALVAWRLRPPGDTGTFASSTISAVLERPNTTSKWVQAAAGSPPVHEFDVDFARLCGVSKAAFAADISEYEASVGAAPNRPVSMALACAGTSGSEVIQVIVEVMFDVVFHQREVLAQS